MVTSLHPLPIPWLNSNITSLLPVHTTIYLSAKFLFSIFPILSCSLDADDPYLGPSYLDKLDDSPLKNYGDLRI